MRACRHPSDADTKPRCTTPLLPKASHATADGVRYPTRFTWQTRAFHTFPFPQDLGSRGLGGSRIKDVSAVFLVAVQPQGSSSAEVLAGSVPDAVSLYPHSNGRDEPTRGSMTLPLCQLAHLNIFALCFSAVLQLLLIRGWGCCIPPGRFSSEVPPLFLRLPAVLC